MPDADPTSTADVLGPLLEVTRQLALPIELDAMLSAIIDAGRSMLHADRGSVFLYDADTRELYAKVATAAGEIRFSIDRGIAGQCARTRAIINVGDCYADDRFNREIDRASGYRTDNLIAIPLIGMDDQLVGVLQLLNAKRGHFNEHDERVAAALASQAAIALQRARLLEDRLVRIKLEHDLDLAREIQQATLPDELPTVAGYDLAAFNRAPEETGGDIFDVVRRPEHYAQGQNAPVMLLLADATGHGIGPALSIMQTRAMFRMGLRMGASLEQLLHHLNQQVHEDTTIGRFVTGFIGRLDPAAHQLTYHAAGQGPIAHYNAATQTVEFLSATTIPMGIVDDIPADPPPPIALHAGDIIALLTDGFYERTNPQREQMGEPRIGEVIAAHAEASAAAIVQALVAAQDEFANPAPQDDDLTAIIIKRREDAE